MKTRNIQLIGICIFACILLGAFQNSPGKSRIRIEIDKKLENYRRVEEKRCLEKMYERAAALADSILMDRSRSKATDTLVKPPIPLRPHRPEVLFPKDSTPVAPFLKQDTLGQE